MPNICKVHGCEKKCHGQGYCDNHYRLYKRWGKPEKTKNINGLCKNNKELYAIYNSMKQRCYNPKVRNYNNYGGRGIEVCDRWLGKNGFENFLNDMGKRPEGYSIDRIDNNIGYSPKNCRWASPKEQGHNKRNNKWYEYKGKRKLLKEWSKELGIPMRTLEERVRKGDYGEYLFRAPDTKKSLAAKKSMESRGLASEYT